MFSTIYVSNNMVMMKTLRIKPLISCLPDVLFTVLVITYSLPDGSTSIYISLAHFIK